VAGGEVMTQEERINELENKIIELEVKLMNTLCLLRESVLLDRGFDNSTTEQLAEHIEYLLRY
jgi:hypothetical protein